MPIASINIEDYLLALIYYQGYQFWTRADSQGYFSINNVSPATYNLYAWVPGFIGDYRSESTITITAGHTTIQNLAGQQIS